MITKEDLEDIDVTLNVAIVGRIHLKHLNKFKELITSTPSFYLVYYKQSGTTKLWIKEGGDSKEGEP